MTLVAISNVFGRIHAAEVNRSSRRSNCHILHEMSLSQSPKLKVQEKYDTLLQRQWNGFGPNG